MQLHSDFAFCEIGNSYRGAYIISIHSHKHIQMRTNTLAYLHSCVLKSCHNLTAPYQCLESICKLVYGKMCNCRMKKEYSSAQPVYSGFVIKKRHLDIINRMIYIYVCITLKRMINQMNDVI